MVQHAIELLPEELTPVLDNVVITCADRNNDEPELLGLYEGVPHGERNGNDGPDVITIYRHAHCDVALDEDDLASEVAVTVLHEIAHAAGIDDDRLEELGWG